MSVMVAEPDPISSEKRPPLLYKEQTIERIVEDPEIQMMQEITRQSVEAAKIIFQDEIQQYTLEQISDTSVSQDVKELEKPGKVLSRDRPQRPFDVIVGTNRDSTDETRNIWKGKGGNQTMTEGMSIDKGELSVERECDMSVLIKQICTEYDVMSQCFLCLSGLRRMLECCTKAVRTLQGIAGVSTEKEMSDHRGNALQRDYWYLEAVDG